jgi:hypothetical protein
MALYIFNISLFTFMVVLLGPCYYLPAPVMMFNQSRATLHPISIVHVYDTVNVLYFGSMYVPADHTIKATFFTIGHKILFKLEDKVHSLFNSILEILTQAPVSKPQSMANPIKFGVDAKNEIIGFVTQK